MLLYTALQITIRKVPAVSHTLFPTPSAKRSFGRIPARALANLVNSLPKSAIKTFHVKCSNGRLGMVRYDTRTEPTKMCVSVQDASRAQSCVTVTQQQAPGHVGVLGAWVCQ
jgi:hypothetical protein